MNDSHPGAAGESPPVPNDRQSRRVPRTVIAGAVIVAVFAFIAWNQWRRPQLQAELIEQIRAAGGFVQTEAPPSTGERIEGLRSGVKWEDGGLRSGAKWEDSYTEVGLYGPDMTGDWLRAHDNLSALGITRLKLSETGITGDELARLIAAHPIHVLELREQDLNDSTVEALAASPKLNTLELRDSPLTDAQFPRLPLEQLDELLINGTEVTSAGLAPLQRAKVLTFLTLDGRQFDESAAKLVASLPSLQYLELVGTDVTDEDLLQLYGMTKLSAITLIRTSVTDEGVTALETALPECVVGVR